MRIASLAFGIAGFMAVASTAAAQSVDNIGNQGQVVVGVDRVTGVFVDDMSITLEETPSPGISIKGESDVSVTTVGLFGMSSVSPSATPRLALDFFVTDGLSLGGSFVYLTQSGDGDGKITTTAGGQSQTTTEDVTLDTESQLTVLPRVGYALIFDETFGLWPRVGINYTRRTRESEEAGVIDPVTGSRTTWTETMTMSTTNLALEAMLVISPFSHFAFLLGPFFDIPLGGSIEYDTDQPGATAPPDGDLSISSYGVSASLVGYF